MSGVTVVDHPLVARHLSVLRDRATRSSDFRRRLSDVSMLLLYEALRDLRVREDDIDTPLETTGGMRLADEIVVTDPMLATGGSAVHALERIKRDVNGRLRFVCLVAAAEGLEAMRKAHPDVPIWCAAIDRQLDERGYIRPGLGDAGDRIFGTE